MASKSDYFDLGRGVSLVLAIIPFTSWICGVVTRALEGKYLAAILRAFFGFNIVWICDLVFMIMEGRIIRCLDNI